MKRIVIATVLLSASALVPLGSIAQAQTQPASPVVSATQDAAGTQAGSRDGMRLARAEFERDGGRRHMRGDREMRGDRDMRGKRHMRGYREGREHGKWHKRDRGERHGRHHGERRGGPMQLAARLSAVETYVGIRSDQLDAWRGYTTALIDFFDRPGPRVRGGQGRPMAPGDAGAQGDRPLMAEMMADRAIARAAKAETLKQAVQALRDVLTPDQLEKLAQAERMGRGHHRGGPERGHRGPGWRGMGPQGQQDQSAAPDGEAPETPSDDN